MILTRFELKEKKRLRIIDIALISFFIFKNILFNKEREIAREKTSTEEREK